MVSKANAIKNAALATAPAVVRAKVEATPTSRAPSARAVQRAAAGKLARPCKRSELVRAGIKARSAMTDSALLATLGSVPASKPGRSAKP